MNNLLDEAKQADVLKSGWKWIWAAFGGISQA